MLVIKGRAIKRARTSEQSHEDRRLDFEHLFDELSTLQRSGLSINGEFLSNVRVRHVSWLPLQSIQDALDERARQEVAATGAEAAPLPPVHVPLRSARTSTFPHSTQLKRNKILCVVESLRRFDLEFKIDFPTDLATLLNSLSPPLATLTYELDIVFAGTRQRPRVAENTNESDFKLGTRATNETDASGNVRSCIFDSDAKTKRRAECGTDGVLKFVSVYLLQDMISNNLKAKRDFQFVIRPVHPALQSFGWLICYSPPFHVLARLPRGIRQERKKAAAAGGVGGAVVVAGVVAGPSTAADIVAAAQVEQPQQSVQ